MVKRSKKYPNAFFERGSWYYRTKTLNEDYTVTYGKLGGFDSAEDAEKAYKLHIEEFNRKLRAKFIDHNGETLLKDYMVYWFQSIFSERVKSTTLYVCGYALYSFLLPHIEDDVKLRLVSTDYLNDLLSEAAKHCESSGNKSREVLYLAMKDAVVLGLIQNNPVAATQKYSRKKPNIRILSREDTKTFLYYAKSRNWFLEILLALYCGLRKGEILALKFSDFDLEKRTLHVQRQLVSDVKISTDKEKMEVLEYSKVVRDPKSEAGNRIMGVPTIILVELEKRRRAIQLMKERMGAEYIDADYISCQKNGLPHGLCSLNTEIRRICIRNNLPRITVHSLRHMFATILIERNVSIAKISGLLGHSSVHTTFEFYLEVMDADAQIQDYLNREFVYGA